MRVLRKLVTILVISVVLITMAACGKTISTGKTEVVVQKETTSQVDGSSKVNPSDNKDSKKQETKQPEIKEEQTTQNNAGTITEGGYQEVATQAEQPTQAEPQTQAPVPEYVVYITVDAQGCGGVLASATLTYSYPPTVYDALCSCGVGIEGSSYYVSAINGIREREHGPMSGWLFSVNGYTPMESAGAYCLNNGDNVYWFYQVDE